MTIKRCDRCGGVYDRYRTLGTVEPSYNAVCLCNTDNNDSKTFERLYDLCPSCALLVYTFIVKDGKKDAKNSN